MVIDLILLVIFNSLYCVGFYAACSFSGDESFDIMNRETKQLVGKPTDRMILWWFRYYVGRYVSHWWSKPLYSCLTCMGSVHSIIPTILYFGFMGLIWWKILIIIPFVIGATAGLNYLISLWWSENE